MMVSVASALPTLPNKLRRSHPTAPRVTTGAGRAATGVKPPAESAEIALIVP
jgi:hypothetical protein